MIIPRHGLWRTSCGGLSGSLRRLNGVITPLEQRPEEVHVLILRAIKASTRDTTGVMYVYIYDT